MEEIDIDKLRQDLIDYYTAAMFMVSPVALVDLTEVENADSEKVKKIALDNGFNLDNYIKWIINLNFTNLTFQLKKCYNVCNKYLFYR